MKKKQNSLVWQILPPVLEKDSIMEGHRKASFILGTMHVRDASAFQFEPIFYAHILKCQAFATELNLDDMQKESGFALALPNGLQLSDLIKPKIFTKISHLVERNMGVPLTHFNYLKPIMVTNMLTESVLSIDRMKSLDETLWDFAKKNGLLLRGIETIDEQVEVLEKMSYEEQIKGLTDLAANFTKFRQQLLNMTALYVQADIQKLYKAARRSTKGSRRLLLFDRNVKMADRIADLSQDMTVCAAIGAGHLAGKKGVLKLLKDKGFEVKPVFKKD